MSSYQFDTFSAVLSALAGSPRDRQGKLLESTDYTFKVLVSLVGELAALNTESSSSQDPEMTSKILGAMASCVVALSSGYGVNLGSAVSSFLFENNATHSDNARKSLKVNPSAPQQGSDQDLLLSPRTASNFFPELDRYRSKSREDYKNELSWFVVLDDGSIFDLKPNGRNIPVTYDELPYYLNLAMLHRRTPAPNAEPPVPRPIPQVVPSDSTPVQRVTKVLSVNAPAGYNPTQEAAMFSPTHFQNGLFAPLQTATSLQVTYDRTPEGSPPVRGTPSASQNRGNSASQQGGQSDAERAFWATVGKIERHEISRDEVAGCNLTFSVPTSDGQIIELISNGAKIQVNRNNVDSFLSSVKEKMSNPNTSRVIRTNSIRPMAVHNVPYNPIVDQGKFSPSHFSNDLFSPFNSNTAVNVDLNDQAIVPNFLRAGGANSQPSNRGGSTPQQSSQMAQYRDPLTVMQQTMGQNQSNNNQHGGGASAIAALRNNTASARNKNFVDRIRSSDDEFVAILSQLDANHNLATEFGVTYCVPTACVNKSVLQQNPSANYDGIYDLIPNGRNVAVAPSSISDYFQMVEVAAKV